MTPFVTCKPPTDGPVGGLPLCRWCHCKLISFWLSVPAPAPKIPAAPLKDVKALIQGGLAAKLHSAGF